VGIIAIALGIRANAVGVARNLGKSHNALLTRSPGSFGGRCPASWLNREPQITGALCKLLDQYFDLQKQIFDYFGYVEDWREIPIDDAREYFWHLTGEGHGDGVKFAREEKNLFEGTMDDGYSNEIYTQRFLPKWVYRGKDYTMICVDTHTDGNKFLQIFDNAKERPESV